MTGRIVKEISLNSFPSKKINLKFSKKKNQKPSNNKMSLKYLLSNNPDSKKKLSLLLNNNQKRNDSSPSEIVIRKKEFKDDNKNSNNNSEFSNRQKNTVIDCQISSKKDKKIIKGGNVIQPSNKLNNILPVLSNSTKITLTNSKESNQKENSLLNKTSFEDSNKLKNKYGGNQDKIKISNEIIKINKNLPKTNLVPEKRQFSKISGEQTITNQNVKKRTSNKSSKKTKVISLDIETPKKSDNKKRTKFIHKVNSLRKKEIKQILVRNHLIKNNSKAPEDLMKNILIDSVELGVNLV
jgi:hypothetical protein